MSSRRRVTFGIGLQMTLLVLVIVAATVWQLPRSLSREAEKVLLEHERVDLADETRQQGWELLDRLDTLRHDAAMTANRLQPFLESGQEPQESDLKTIMPDEYQERYLRIEIVNLDGEGVTFFREHAEQVSAAEENADAVSETRARTLFANSTTQMLPLLSPFFLEDHPYELKSTFLDEMREQLEKERRRLVWDEHSHVIWCGVRIPTPSDDAQEKTTLVMIALGLDDYFWKIAGSPRHLGFLYDQDGNWYLHPDVDLDLSPEGELGRQLPIEDQIFAWDKLEGSEVTENPLPFIDRAGEFPFIRYETPRFEMGRTYSDIPLSAGNEFYYAESSEITDPTPSVLKEMFDQEELNEPTLDEWYRRVYIWGEKKNRSYWKEEQTSSAGKQNLRRMSTPSRELKRTRLIADDRSTLKRSQDEISREFLQKFHVELKAWSDETACTVCTLAMIRFRLDPATSSDEQSNDRQTFILGRAAFVEEQKLQLSTEMLPIRRGAYLWAVVATGLAVLASFLLTRPLKRMTQVAESIVAADLGSNLSTDDLQGRVNSARKKLKTRRKDEIGVLAGAFVRMLDEIDRRHQNLNSLVKTRTESLREANHRLEDTIQDLQLAHEAHKRLVFSISHDLKTPLAIVKGYCEELMDSTLTEEQQEDLNTISRNLDRLQRLIEDILDSQKIGLGELELDPKTFEITQIVRELARGMQLAATRGGNELVLECPQELPSVYSDPDKVTRILENLLSNACKFTQQGTITLSAKLEQDNGSDQIVLGVADNGKGIALEKHESIFKPFPKILSKSENPRGTGLGLSNCKGYCDALGGTIDFTSAPGEGTTFTVKIPTSPAASTRLSSTRLKKSGRYAHPVDAANSKVTKRVLIIDDEPDIRSLLRRFLERENFDVIESGDGLAGAALAKQERPSLITLDALMPGVDGWSVLKLLKSDAQTADIPVVMVSVLDDKLKGFALGASDYITKPIDWDRLLRTLEKYRFESDQNTILIVDDDPDVRELASRRLQDHGWSVLEAEHGCQAMEILQQGARPRLILLDLLMPEMDGFEFIEELRIKPEFQEIPVLVLTGKELDAEDRHRLNGRVNQVMQKDSMNWDAFASEVCRLCDDSLQGQNGDQDTRI